MSEDGDYIKLYRKVKESKVWYYTHAQYRVWETILLSVNWGETWGRHNGEEIKISPGQMVTSIEHLADVSQTSKNIVRKTLKKLEKDDMIETDRTHQGTLLTVLNWGKYQKTEGVWDTRTDTRSDTRSDMQADPQGDTRSDHTRRSTKKNKKNTSPSGESDERLERSEDDDFRDQQGFLVELLEPSPIEESDAWGLVGRWINSYGYEACKQALTDLYAKEAWQDLNGRPAKGFAVESIKRVVNGADRASDGSAITEPEDLPSYRKWKSLPDHRQEQIASRLYPDKQYPMVNVKNWYKRNRQDEFERLES